MSWDEFWGVRFDPREMIDFSGAGWGYILLPRDEFLEVCISRHVRNESSSQAGHGISVIDLYHKSKCNEVFVRLFDWLDIT